LYYLNLIGDSTTEKYCVRTTRLLGNSQVVFMFTSAQK